VALRAPRRPKTEAAVLSWLDAHAPDLFRRARWLVAQPTDGGREALGQAIVADALRYPELQIERWEPDPALFRGHPGYLPPTGEFHGRPNLFATLPGSGGGRSLALNGHIDVVPPGDRERWGFDPWHGKEDRARLYGRGTADMKGGLAAQIFALKAIVESGIRLRGTLQLQSVIAEEDGGAGTLASVLRGDRADLTIISEPTGLALGTSHCGRLLFRLTVIGKGTHAAVRDRGVSAIEKASILHEAIQRLEAERNRGRRPAEFRHLRTWLAVNLGRIEGGTKATMVPERAVLEGRMGLPPGEAADHAKAALQRSIRRASARDKWLAKHPPMLEWFGVPSGPGKLRAPSITAFLRACGRPVLRRPLAVRGMPYGSDMRLITEVARRPAVLFGPGDIAETHAINESVPKAEVLAAAKILALAALRWCGVHDSGA